MKEINSFFTIRDLMKALLVSRQTVYNWMAAGKLKFYKFGKALRFKGEDVHDFIEKHRLDRPQQRRTKKRTKSSAKQKI